jgi:hypothetical protein
VVRAGAVERTVGMAAEESPRLNHDHTSMY